MKEKKQRVIPRLKFLTSIICYDFQFYKYKKLINACIEMWNLTENLLNLMRIYIRIHL